jgi:hypothetical protein
MLCETQGLVRLKTTKSGFYTASLKDRFGESEELVRIPSEPSDRNQS